MHTEHDYIQHVKEYETQTLGLWDKLLLVALGVSLLMLFIALASVGAEAEETRLTISQEGLDTLYFRTKTGEDAQMSPLATVIVTIVRSGTAPCPLPPRRLVKLRSGVYKEEQSITINSVACWGEVTWQEEWSTLPEDNGIFLRRVPND